MAYQFKHADISKRPKIVETSHLHAETAPADPTWIMMVYPDKARIFFARGAQLLFLKEFFPVPPKDNKDDLGSEKNYKDVNGQRYRVVSSRSAMERRIAGFISDLMAHLDTIKSQHFARLVVAGDPVLMGLIETATPAPLREFMSLRLDIAPNIVWREIEGQLLDKLKEMEP